MYPVRRYGDDLGREKTKIIDPRLAERERVLVERVGGFGAVCAKQKGRQEERSRKEGC